PRRECARAAAARRGPARTQPAASIDAGTRRSACRDRPGSARDPEPGSHDARSRRTDYRMLAPRPLVGDSMEPTSAPRQVASRLNVGSPCYAEYAQRAIRPWWAPGYPERGVPWLCHLKNTICIKYLSVAWALLSSPPMATTQRTSTRTVLTGIAVLLAGWLAHAGAAQAEVETTP